MLDRTLETMRNEHHAHEPKLERLLEICRTLDDTPERLPEMRKDLRDVAKRLADEFKTHLAQEEAVVLPAIKTLLSDKDRQAMLDELRARRVG